MPEVSKQLGHETDEGSIDIPNDQQVTEDVQNDKDDDELDEDEPTDNTNTDAAAVSSGAKKKRSKKAKLKKAFGSRKSADASVEESSTSANPASKLTPGMVEQLLEMNPSLKSEVAGMNKEKAAQTLKKLDVADLLTGMVKHRKTPAITVLIRRNSL